MEGFYTQEVFGIMGESGINQEMGVCIITHPFLERYKGEIQVLSKFSSVLTHLYAKVFVITNTDNVAVSERVYVRKRKYYTNSKSSFYLIRYIMGELFTTLELLKVRKDVNVIFFLGWIPVLSCLIARLLGKRIVLILHTSIPLGVKETYRGCIGKLLSSMIERISRINYSLSKLIMIDSESLIRELGLDGYKEKVRVGSSIFVDTNIFKFTEEVNKRENLVGYIGRFSEEKGIINLIDAIPKILEENQTVKFLIIGDGPLFLKLKKRIGGMGFSDRLFLLGWVPYEKIPDYLEEMKLLVLPSYIEGIPNIVLEAMACGTPILATPVGAIPDVIKDCETGFIMENNSPEFIAKNVIRALNYLGLSRVVKNARALIEEKYTYEAAVERYRNILSGLQSK